MYDSLPKWQCSRCWKKYTFDEFRDLPSCWVDRKEHRKYGRTTVCFCGAIFHKDTWHLSSFVDEYRVFTVHLNMGHPDNEDFLNNRHLYFETMINKKEEWLGFQARYESMQQAIDGHFLAVDNLSNIILNPEKYPSSIIDTFCNSMRAANDQRKTIDPSIKKRLT